MHLTAHQLQFLRCLQDGKPRSLDAIRLENRSRDAADKLSRMAVRLCRSDPPLIRRCNVQSARPSQRIPQAVSQVPGSPSTENGDLLEHSVWQLTIDGYMVLMEAQQAADRLAQQRSPIIDARGHAHHCRVVRTATPSGWHDVISVFTRPEATVPWRLTATGLTLSGALMKARVALDSLCDSNQQADDDGRSQDPHSR